MALRALGSFPPRGSAELKQVWLCSRLQRRLIRCLLTIALPWWRRKAYFHMLLQGERRKYKVTFGRLEKLLYLCCLLAKGVMPMQGI